MNLAGVEGENGAQAGVFLPYSRHALPWKTGVPRLLRETEFSGGDLTYQLITGIETLQ